MRLSKAEKINRGRTAWTTNVSVVIVATVIVANH
jgi:hypothetical protein